eukprot:jgi/Orpsp1_1/1189188/evm.model.d7180000070108.1
MSGISKKTENGTENGSATLPKEFCFLNNFNEKHYETTILTLYFRKDGSAFIEEEYSTPGSAAGNTFGGKFYRDLPRDFWREFTDVQIAEMYPSLTGEILRDGRLAEFIERLKNSDKQGTFSG